MIYAAINKLYIYWILSPPCSGHIKWTSEPHAAWLQPDCSPTAAWRPDCSPTAADGPAAAGFSPLLYIKCIYDIGTKLLTSVVMVKDYNFVLF